MHRLKVLCEKCRLDYALNITRYLIDQSSRVIVVYGKPDEENLSYTLDYARTMERDQRIIEI